MDKKEEFLKSFKRLCKKHGVRHGCWGVDDELNKTVCIYFLRMDDGTEIHAEDILRAINIDPDKESAL